MKISTRRPRQSGLRILCFLTLSFLAISLSGPAARATSDGGDTPRRGGPTRTDGYVPFYFDGARGRVLMEIPVFDQDVLYYVSAATNPGSVEAPFDRGIIFSSVIHFVHFQESET